MVQPGLRDVKDIKEGGSGVTDWRQVQPKIRQGVHRTEC